ncbi:MAG TPA: LysR family transcriptional regulator [Steroidobacteraceae bacterium]|nr:LysR family transcriptional regulator [Steroidobacteraceae bacterium]
MPLDLKHLRQIAVIAQTGNFAKAAQRLSISQPALSRSVQSLEHRLGTRLFDRGRSGVVPTPTGKVLLARAEELLKHAAEIEREIDLLLGRGTGHLTIGAGPYPAAISIGSAVARLTRDYPGLSVSVRVGHWDDLTRSVLEAELDLAVAELASTERDPRLTIEPLPRHPGTYFCRKGHPLTQLAVVRPADIQTYPVATTVLPQRLEHLATKRRLQEADRVFPWIHVNTFDLARQIVIESDAIGLAVVDQIDDEVAAGLLVSLNVELPGMYSNYGIIRLAGRTLSPAAAAFIEILRDVEARITSEKPSAPQTIRKSARGRRQQRA